MLFAYIKRPTSSHGVGVQIWEFCLKSINTIKYVKKQTVIRKKCLAISIFFK